MKDGLHVIKKIFPELACGQYHKIKIDNKSFSYISTKQYADKISKLIIKRMEEIGLENKNITITDATACIGGNTLSFSKYFEKVIAIEIDELRAQYLRNNIKLYESDNVTVINNDCTKVNVTQDILFYDPPWCTQCVGMNYKEVNNLTLKLGDTPIETLCNNVAVGTKMIVLKLPTNYNMKYFIEKVIHKNITIVNIKKMLIVIVVC
jgi:predicted RNA methylase